MAEETELDRERAEVYADLARRAVEAGASFLRATRAECIKWKGALPPNQRNCLGDDIDATVLREIDELLQQRTNSTNSWHEAQLRELAFWRWVAFEGALTHRARLITLTF